MIEEKVSARKVVKVIVTWKDELKEHETQKGNNACDGKTKRPREHIESETTKLIQTTVRGR